MSCLYSFVGMWVLGRCILELRRISEDRVEHKDYLEICLCMFAFEDSIRTSLVTRLSALTSLLSVAADIGSKSY